MGADPCSRPAGRIDGISVLQELGKPTMLCRMNNMPYILKEGALSEAPQVFSQLWGTRPPLLVADVNTWEAAGKMTESFFHQHGFEKTERFIFDESEELPADYEHVTRVREQIQNTSCIPVAIGGGTINDLVKLASHECSREYLCIPTAPSVDGYSSCGAAIIRGHVKQTILCPPPKAIVADLKVLCAAPSLLIASGYGDLMAKITAGADWIIADRLRIEAIDPQIWDLVQTPLCERLANPDALARRDASSIAAIFSGLAEVGFAMELYHDTRPASGAEHLMSHIWEMMHLSIKGKSVSHGFKVAIGTLIAHAMMRRLIEMDNHDLAASFARHPGITWSNRLVQITQLLHGEPATESIVKTARKKFLEMEHLNKRRKDILDQWDTLRERLTEQLLPYDRMKDMLERAGCPTEPADIALDRKTVAIGMRKAQLIRTRYTVLDLAYETGMLDTLVDEIANTDTWFKRFAS